MIEYDPQAWNRQPTGFIPREGERAVPDAPAKNLVEAVMAIPYEDRDMLLDVGCCDGRYLDWLRMRGFISTYVGVDITPAFLERARKNNPYDIFDIGDVRDLKFKDECFDVVMCPNVLMHLPDLTPMAELFRVSRRYVLISIYGADKENFATDDGAFLNRWYTKGAVLGHVPQGWVTDRFWDMKPEWSPSARIHQYLFRRQS